MTGAVAQGGVHGLDLAAELSQASGVLDHEVGGGSTLLGRGLGSHAGRRLVTVESAFDGSVEAKLLRRLDRHHGVIAPTPAAFRQQRYLEDHDGPITGGPENLQVPLADEGMNRPFQTLSACRVAEHPASQSFLVDGAVRLQHLRAEEFRYRGSAALTGSVQLGHQRVRIRDDAAQLGKHRADRRLAAGDAAGETHL